MASQKHSTKTVWLFLVGFFLIVGGIYFVIQKSPRLIGGQKDANGCLPAAGYSWCQAKQICLRPWEQYCTAAKPTVVTFTCDNSKSITATFYPTDDKFIDIVLSDGRKLSLPHAASGSGARYTNTSENVVFWNKGNTAFITENSVTTFANCVSLSK